MKAEDQSMLVEEAQGQQTVQALFVQTRAKEVPTILNLTFERDAEDGKLYYVFSGTSDHYVAFRAMMEDYGVYPAHEVEGNRHNAASAAQGAQQEGDERTAEAAPAVADVPDTLSAAPAELSATDGEVVKPAEGAADVASVHSPEQPANGGQPASGDGGQTGGASAGGDDVHGGADAGRPDASGGGSGGEATGANGAGTVSGEVTAEAAADPFADI